MAGDVTRRSALASIFSAAAVAGLSSAVAKPQPHIVRHRLEDFGVVGGDRGDAVANTAAINKALIALARPIEGRPGERYRVAPHIRVPSGAGIVGAGGAPFHLHMAAADFTNVDPRTSESPAGTLLLLDGGRARPAISGVLFEGFAIIADPDPGRVLTAFFVSNVADFRARGIEIAGFPNGFGFTMGSLKGDSAVTDCHIHDFFDDSIVDAKGQPWLARVQSTGITIDDFRRAGPSDPVRITGNRIENIMKGRAFAQLPAQGGSPGHPVGMQTGGIGIAHPQSGGHMISDNIIGNVEQAIDCYGHDCTIANNHIRNIWAHGLKFIHGAQGNRCTGNIIANVGRAGIVMAASNTIASPTAHNLVSGGSISGTGYNDVWAPVSRVAAIRFESMPQPPALGYPMHNRVIGVTVTCDAHCQFGWSGDNDADLALDNIGQDIRFIGRPAMKRVDIRPSKRGFYSGSVTLAGTTAPVTDLI